MEPLLTHPEQIAARGREIYDRKYKESYERDHGGKFVAIDIETEEAFLAEDSVKATEAGQKANPGHLFYLMRVGYPGAFQLGYLGSAYQQRVV